jgi:hypothetical protein
MIRKISYLILLSLLVAAFLAMSASASSKLVERRVINPNIYKGMYYSFPDEHQRPAVSGVGESNAPLGGYKSSSFTVSPGLVIGHTWYDYQRNGSMRRMVGWGHHRDEDPDSPGDSIDVYAVHFNWMRLMPPLDADRHYAYQEYIDTVGKSSSLRFPGDGHQVQPAGDWSGYVVLDVDHSDRAVLGGHWEQGGAPPFRSAFWLDRVPSGAFFATASVPDSVQAYVGTPGPGCTGQEVIWPAMAYQEGPTDTVLHVIASVSDADSPCPTAQ